MLIEEIHFDLSVRIFFWDGFYFVWKTLLPLFLLYWVSFIVPGSWPLPRGFALFL